MRDIPYAIHTFDNPNPLARYAHRSRMRRSIAYADGLLSHGGRLLDYGCGDGDFLLSFGKARPDAELVGYHPVSSAPAAGLVIADTMKAIEDRSIDVFACFEVLEHLTDQQLSDFVADVKRTLRPEGKLLVSVPIIGGPTLLLKEINRMILFRMRSDYSAGELLRAAFLGIPAERPQNRIRGHKGFDFRAIRSFLSATFRLLHEDLCPFSALPWWLNSQAFFVFGYRK